LISLGQELRQAYLAAHVGEHAAVLYETQKNGIWLGHTPEYMPVYTESPFDLRGIVRDTILTEIRDDGYWGQLL
jgi:threonylcarbamoyladenosine tRNA methylthiotransferase MtaB